MSDDNDIRALASDLAGGELVAVRYSLLADDDWDHGAIHTAPMGVELVTRDGAYQVSWQQYEWDFGITLRRDEPTVLGVRPLADVSSHPWWRQRLGRPLGVDLHWYGGDSTPRPDALILKVAGLDDLWLAAADRSDDGHSSGEAIMGLDGVVATTEPLVVLHGLEL
ncbi:hypothetical protein HH308_28555 [Gordonia sp. TBRC 11910]|uniref:Uncharacterized protein n=1 Tax=Gordonia asplenii TaxID=2725283 RepID=A0A848L877_9ACTN|nr:hypothetical protein [Gordonia asplenii]NMO05175.1 hypothetical protein [Gordonia asplenii]